MQLFRHLTFVHTLAVCLLLSLVPAAIAEKQTGDARLERQADGQFVAKSLPVRELLDANILDADTLADLSDFVDVEGEVTWRLYVPANYDPAAPAGLFVYISPTPRGFMPRGWRTAFDDNNLIWVSADNSGNDVPTALRMLYAVAATSLVPTEYQIDTDRIYLAGFSGGGKMASIVSVHFADLFSGGMFIGGAEYWKSAPPQLDAVLENRYAFVAGSRDFNLDLTKRTYGRFRRAGVRNTKLQIVKNMGHNVPRVDVFRDTLRFLDGDAPGD